MAAAVRANLGVLLVSLLWSGVISVTVNSPSGTLQGDVNGNVNRFLGVPFANTPQRFEKAELISPWAGTRNATEFGPACYQALYLDPTNRSQSEDCLLLDIYTPVDLGNSEDLSNKRAVMVWIHGGAFLLGSSSDYEGSKLAEAGDVVVVGIQYRLGPFGFLYTGGLKPSNLGLWDQRLALEWIQANIWAFGGDRDKVTVFGESAGAMSISAHLISPQVNNTLFQRAILQSGSVISGDRTKNARDSAAATLAANTGCADTSTTALALDCLNDVPASTLSSAAVAIIISMWPTTDDDYLPIDTLTLLEEYKTNGTDGIKNDLGNLAQYDTLMGFNGQEGLFLLPIMSLGLQSDELDAGFSDDVYHSGIQINFFSTLVSDTDRQNDITKAIIYEYKDDKIAGIEDRSSNEKNMRRMVDVAGDWMLMIPTYYAALFHSEVAPDMKSYFYLFDHKPSTRSMIDEGPDWLKTTANHADEIQFIFSMNVYNTLTTDEVALSQALMTYWTNFAKTGLPNSAANADRGGVEWEEFSPEETNYMRFTLEEDELLEKPRGNKPDFALCIYWAISDDDNDLGECKDEKEDKSATAFTQHSPKLSLIILFILAIFSS